LDKKYVISIIGGTGREGKGLAYCWVKAGHRVIIGSREASKAEQAVNEIKTLVKGNDIDVIGMENYEAAKAGEIIVLTIPYAAHSSTLIGIRDSVSGKIVVDVTVPLVPPKVTKAQMPDAGSAAMEAKMILGDSVRVASAFQNISYENLMSNEGVECDVLVCGETREVRDTILSLVEDAGLKGWDGGPLENSMVVEGFTSILIGINKRYGSTSAGIRITGVTKKEENRV
jgi:8-hydroxy-5-deazaflavin:NADPH oxidoreductase